ncbi:MAG: N-acetylmuramoyl-L-alanine amidase [Acidobacteriota bacterium]|nr:N-acetylmuramoyl-L-alanine amidase [Acidobacteriota bacterium]
MGKKILISAGHSTVPPKDPGAVSGKYVEAQLALRMRDMVADRLRAKGFTVIEDGADGVSEPLRKAIALCPQADTRVEFHFNAGPPTATGVEVLSLPKYKALSQKIAGAVAQATGQKLRGDKGWKNQDSGQHHRLGFCMAGGVIVELAFISNAADMQRYLQAETAVADRIAEALAT